MSRHYVLQGKRPVPVSFEEYLEYAKEETGVHHKHVADEIYKGFRISTVFLGLDHAHGEYPPLLFETMIFPASNLLLEDEYQTRCSTWEEAEEMHKQAKEAIDAGEICHK